MVLPLPRVQTRLLLQIRHRRPLHTVRPLRRRLHCHPVPHIHSHMPFLQHNLPTLQRRENRRHTLAMPRHLRSCHVWDPHCPANRPPFICPLSPRDPHRIPVTTPVSSNPK
ncbi:hypothetical protein BLNAU_16412 [Blattamonas nauphoetae]|uniref:Uncharacterized protein n=1 Tax=Blattamonas nauphoetae TaxID=2049346 RepID=A0ABQ9XED7_9EUKA|nr:hypothetical protein BLNAU_16412 [Blattamonas nauphoetae]